MTISWEESSSTGYLGGCHELWSHRSSGDYYAVQIRAGQVLGACRLGSPLILAQRRALTGGDFDLALGAQLADRRHEFAVVEQW
jgi:hypothetical protein